MKQYYCESTNFYGLNTPFDLIRAYGSPLYVYNEAIFRTRCREMKGFINYPHIAVNYSIKANSNLTLLKIAREEGLRADAVSPGEIYHLQKAGYPSEEIFFIPNNASDEEMRYAIERDILLSADSISQLERYGRLNPDGSVAVRFNPGVGAGHHEKVVTGGDKSKFGVMPSLIPKVKEVLQAYNLKLVGINQHIGSLFMEGSPYMNGVQALLSIAENFDDLEFIDLGGGFGVPYRKQEGEARFDLVTFGAELGDLLSRWTKGYGKPIRFIIEPGRYVPAESGVLLGTVHAVKQSYGKTYIGTDLGFNVLSRPVLYDAYHEIEVYPREPRSGEDALVTLVGNLCETGDILAKDRSLPPIKEDDVIGVMDAGAYGYVMSSNYNCRLRPAEVLIRVNGDASLIRRRETLEDLMRGF